jgi:hypothetical protein
MHKYRIEETSPFVKSVKTSAKGSIIRRRPAHSTLSYKCRHAKLRVNENVSCNAYVQTYLDIMHHVIDFLAIRLSLKMHIYLVEGLHMHIYNIYQHIQRYSMYTFKAPFQCIVQLRQQIPWKL